MNDVFGGYGLLALLAVAAAGAGAWFAARPLVLASAHRRSGDARARVLGKQALDVLERLDTVVLDPVGTVTAGELSVVSVDPLDPTHDRNLRWFAGALQHTADDPVARAIARLAVRGIVTDVQHEPGVGTAGRVDRHPVRVGRPDWIGVDAPDDGWGRTVAVEVDGRAMGHITVADTVRPQAGPATATLTESGLRVLVVAPSEAKATYLGRAVPTAEVVAVAADVDLVRELRHDGRTVAVVGRAGESAVPLDAGDLAVTDAAVDAPAAIDMSDVAVHHVASVLMMLRGASARLRAARRGVAAVAALALVGLVLVPTGWLELAILGTALAALPIALTMPLWRWR